MSSVVNLCVECVVAWVIDRAFVFFVILSFADVFFFVRDYCFVIFFVAIVFSAVTHARRWTRRISG